MTVRVRCDLIITDVTSLDEGQSVAAFAVEYFDDERQRIANSNVSGNVRVEVENA